MKFEDEKAPILNIYNSIFKEHKLNSQYFLDWIMINFGTNEISWHCQINSNILSIEPIFYVPEKKVKNQFVISSNGRSLDIKFSKMENKIIYNVNNKFIFENDFLHNIIEKALNYEFQEKNHDDLEIKYEKSFFGPLRLRVSRFVNCITARFFLLERGTFKPTKNYLIEPLENILIFLDTHKNFIIDNEEKEAIRNTYYDILEEEIDFNNLDYSLKSINEYKNVLKIINY